MAMIEVGKMKFDPRQLISVVEADDSSSFGYKE